MWSKLNDAKYIWVVKEEELKWQISEIIEGELDSFKIGGMDNEEVRVFLLTTPANSSVSMVQVRSYRILGSRVR